MKIGEDGEVRTYRSEAHFSDDFSKKVLGTMQLLQDEVSQLPLGVENSICCGMSRLSA